MITELPFAIENSRSWPIRGNVVRPTGSGDSRGLVVVSHGFKGFKDWGHFPYVTRHLAEAGFTAVRFNFSGNGIGEDPMEMTETERFKENTLSLEVEDLSLVLAAAGEGRLPGLTAGDATRAALLGHSRGGLVSTVVASRRPGISHLVTWAGVGLLAERYPEDVRARWRAEGVLPVVNSRTGQILEMGLGALDDLESHLDDYSPVTLAATLEVPRLIVHGTADATVPIREAEAVAQAGGGRARLAIIEGGDHTFGAVHPFRGTTPQLEQALQATIEFLSGSESESPAHARDRSWRRGVPGG